MLIIYGAVWVISMLNHQISFGTTFHTYAHFWVWSKCSPFSTPKLNEPCYLTDFSLHSFCIFTIVLHTLWGLRIFLLSKLNKTYHTRSPHARQDFHQGGLKVERSTLGPMVQHGVFPWHLVDGQRMAGVLKQCVLTFIVTIRSTITQLVNLVISKTHLCNKQQQRLTMFQLSPNFKLPP